MGKAKQIGITIGGTIVAIMLILVVYYVSETDDARLASIEAYYDADTDRLTVALILTNKNAEYTKADGHLELTVKKERIKVFTQEYDVTRDDFLSWKNNAGEKITGYRIQETEFFAPYSHDVYVDFTLKDGTNWTDLHATFFSLN